MYRKPNLRAGKPCLKYKGGTTTLSIALGLLLSLTSLQMRAQINLVLANRTNTGALPARLLYFDAAAAGKDVILTWTTSRELNCKRFEIEISDNGIYFNKAGEKAAAGNSDIPLDYSFTHINAAFLNASPLYYRLRQTDIDETATYSKIAIVVTSNADEKILLYPNPVNNGKILTVCGTNIREVSLFSADGRQVWTGSYKDLKQVEIPTAHLPAGTYFIKVNGMADGKVIITR